MSFEDHEQRIAALEKLSVGLVKRQQESESALMKSVEANRKMALFVLEMAKGIRNEVQHLRRFVMERTPVDSESERRNLLTVVSRIERMNEIYEHEIDQVLVQLKTALPPSPLPG